MNKFLIGLTGLIVVVVAALLVGPGLVDWNSYKPRIASLAEQATGRRLSIDGDIKLSILPTPRLSVRSLRLASVPGATDPDMVRLEALDIRIGLLALLSGAIQVEALVLIEPEIELEVLADGRRNWDFGAGTATGVRAPSGDTQAPRLDRLHIENGRLNYRDVRTGRVVQLRAIDADISAKSPEGPFRADGKLTFEGLSLAFVGRLGRLRSGRRAPLSLEVTTNGARAGLTQGSVTPGDNGPRIAGSLTVAGDDLRRLAASAFDGAGQKSALPGWLAQPFSLEGTLDANGRALAINDMVLELGEARVTGAVNLGLDKAMRADVALSAKTIDLDKWLAVETPAPAAASTPARRGVQVAGAATGGGPAIPAELSGSIDLAVDAIAYRGGTVRNARLGATMEAGVVTISNASATLPGPSEIKVEGTLDGSGGRLAYRGGFQGGSSNARALLAWLGLALDRLQAGRLRNLDIKGKIDGTLDELRVTDVAVGFDSSRLTGAITVSLRRRPAFGLAVALDRIDLDAYQPRGPAANAEPAQAGGNVQARAGAWDPLAPMRLLDRFDANVSARIGTLTVNGQPIKGIRFDGQIYNGAITVTTAEVANLAGGKGVVKGSLRNLGSDPAVELSFELEAPDAAKALKVAGITPPNAVAKAGAIRLTGAVKGTVADLEVDVVATAFSGRTEIHGALAWRDAAPAWDLRLEARFPKLRPVLDALGIATVKREMGAFTVAGGTKGSPLSATLDATVGTGGGTMAVAGRIDDPFGAQPTVDVTIQSDGLQPQVLAALVPDPTLGRLLLGLTRLDGKLAATGPARAVSIALDDVRIEGYAGTARVSGAIEDSASGAARLDLKLELRDLDALAIAAATGARYRPRARSVPVSLAGRLTGTLGGRIEAAEITGQIDAVDSAGRHHPTKFSGTARAEFGANRPKYTVELGFDNLALDPYLAREKRQGELRRDRRLIPGVIRAAAPTIQPPAARRIPWTRAAIDVSWLRDFDADIVLKGGGLSTGKVRIDQPRATLALDDGMLNIRELGGGFTKGGTVAANGTIDIRDGVSLVASLNVANADVQRLLGWFAPIDRAAGRLNLDGSFRARGRSQSELISNLGGKATLSGHIQAGKRLEAGVAQLIACTGLSSKLEDVLGDVLGDRLGGLAKGLAPGTGIGVLAKYMDLATVVLANGAGDLSGDIQVDDGLIWTRNIRIVGRQGGGQALISGDVALPAYTVYGQAELKTPESIQYAKRIGRDAPYLIVEYAADLDGNEKKTRFNGLINDRDFKQSSCGSSSPAGQPAGSSDLLKILRDSAREWIGKPNN